MRKGADGRINGTENLAENGMILWLSSVTDAKTGLFSKRSLAGQYIGKCTKLLEIIHSNQLFQEKLVKRERGRFYFRLILSNEFEKKIVQFRTNFVYLYSLITFQMCEHLQQLVQPLFRSFPRNSIALRPLDRKGDEVVPTIFY